MQNDGLDSGKMNQFVFTDSFITNCQVRTKKAYRQLALYTTICFV